MTTRTPAPSAVNWRWVALFYGIAFGGATVVALATFGVRHWLGPAAAIPALVMTAVLYMPMPLVAGLVVERASGRRPLIADEWRALRTSFWRTYARNAAATVLAIAAVVVAAGLIAWLAGALAVPGAGPLVTSDAEFHDRMVQTNPALAGTPLPSLVVFVPMVLAQGILAGLTVNGLFAFGEEYGWRGVLAEELRPLGAVRANLLTGVLWGLWHAPIIILMGHNYGSEWGWGVLVMVAWVTPFSFLLWLVRERTGSVLAPAMLHGAGNGVLGVFTYLVADGNVLVALPVGLLLAVTMAVVAVVAWRVAGPPSVARVAKVTQSGHSTAQL